MKDTMISTGAAAAMLGRDRRTIRRMIADRRLRSFRSPNGEHRLRLADVKALADETDLQRSPAGRSSPALKNREDSLKELSLELQERRLQRKVKRFDEQAEQEEAERQAAAERERQREAEERARARREEEERQRERALETWRTEMLDLFARVPDGAPAALQAAFLDKAAEALARFDCQQPTHVVQALLVAIQQEVFGAWQREAEASARAAWLQKQMEEGWRIVISTSTRERLAVPEDNARRQNLLDKIILELQPFTPEESSLGQLRDARQRAIEALLAPYRKEKALQSIVEGALNGLRSYLRQLHEEGLLRVASQSVDLLGQLLEPKVRRFLHEQGQRHELTPAEAKDLLENFVLEDQRLL